MKKIISIIMSLTMLIFLVGCGNSEEKRAEAIAQADMHVESVANQFSSHTISYVFDENEQAYFIAITLDEEKLADYFAKNGLEGAALQAAMSLTINNPDEEYIEQMAEILKETAEITLKKHHIDVVVGYVDENGEATIYE